MSSLSEREGGTSFCLGVMGNDAGRVLTIVVADLGTGPVLLRYAYDY